MRVANVATQPDRFGAPINVLIRFPGILATATKAEGLEAHGFQRDVAGENHQVGPGNLSSVLLLDRPKQPARLVQADIVRPTVERRETLLAPATTTAAIKRAVGAGAVPGHANEQWTVMPEIRRPPRLRIGHQRREIFFERRVIETLELLRVIKLLAHRIRLRGMLVQELELQLLRPPIAIRHAVGGSTVVKWAFASFAHKYSFFRFACVNCN